MTFIASGKAAARLTCEEEADFGGALLGVVR